MNYCRIDMFTTLSLVTLAVCMPANTFRLPKTIFPSEYSVRIIVDIGSFKFEGIVNVQVQCIKMTRNITLHAKDLEILETAVEVRSAIDKKNLVISHSYVLENDFYVLHLSESLEKGHEYFLRIPYKGNLTEGLTGFYRSSYMDLTTKKTRWLAVTQFESIAARKAFPCFDEPEFKARFKVSLGHAENYQSVSNMPVRCTEAMRERPGWIWTHFLESVCMSTYLVAFLVSDFDFRVFPRIPAANFVNFRVWARHDALQQTEFAGAVGPQILNFYEKFFDINFPLPKQDLVAIPDFSAGAMENWGLITFRESTLLAGKEASSDVRENIAGVIAHELAHQWFGNLVTMKWWNDLWLNEGFATYISHIGVHAIRPEWNTLDLNVVQLLEIVLFHDSFQSSHPISHKVETFTAVNEVFDAISYQKGAFMLRMMSLFLGEEVFRQGLNIYLSIFKYRNAEQDDLWNSLTMVAHQQDVLPHNMTIKMIMDTWTLQIGYPVITITRDYPKGTAKITQKHFRRYKDEENDAESCWILPITYTSQAKHEFQSTIPNAWTLCAENSGQVHGLPSQNEWFLFNIQAASLCRVNYDKYNWHLLINALHSKQYTEIGLLNRVQLVEDAFGLAWTGDLPYCIAMKLASYLVQEIEYAPWKMASNHLEWFKNFLIRTSTFNIFKEYMETLVKHLDYITDIPQTEDISMVRMHLLQVRWSCILDIHQCRAQASYLFKQWMETKDPDSHNPIPTELRDVVYCFAQQSGGRTEWNFAWQRYLNANVGTDKSTLLTALGCTSDHGLLKRYLEKLVVPNCGIRTQDRLQALLAVAQNMHGGYDIARRFFRQHILQFHHYCQVQNGVPRALLHFSRLMYTQEDLKEVDEMVSNNEVCFGKDSLLAQEARENILSNALWFKEHYYNFLQALVSQTQRNKKDNENCL